ncbi:MAG TPA: aldolase/citrate lyase family protein [Chloroflexota bacterium]|nr:aldolase/citrate lyase family protein [Chloroflexota bacterium]
MARENTAKKLLRAGKPAVGIWLNVPSVTSAEALATIGWDWLTLDVEHAPYNLETQQAMFMAIASQGCVPLARIAANDPTIIKQTLDAGAMGVVVPMVCSAEEAKRAVEACKYPPEGIRSAGGGRWRYAYGADWQERANEETLCIVMIEHRMAVDCVEEILSVPGVDACFIGPNDLSWSMGLRGRRDDAHAAALLRVRDAGRATGTPVGLHCGSPQEVVQRIEQGFQFLACQNDMGFMMSGVTAAHKHIRSQIEGA